MKKDISEVLFTTDTAFRFIDQINTSGNTDSSDYTGDERGWGWGKDLAGTIEWAWNLNPPTLQKIFQLQDDE
jgi:hypothetical protein